MKKYSAHNMPLRQKLHFTHDLLRQWTKAIGAICLEHGLDNDDGVVVANEICKLVLPYHEDVNVSRASHRNDGWSINALRDNRDAFIPAIAMFAERLAASDAEQKPESASSESTLRPASSVNEQLSEKLVTRFDNFSANAGTNQGKIEKMNIQKLIQLRRIMSTSFALSSFIEAAYRRGETQYNIATAGRMSQPGGFGSGGLFAPSVAKSNDGSQHSTPWPVNPAPSIALQMMVIPDADYTELSAEQLQQADKKLLEALAILFPEKDNPVNK